MAEILLPRNVISEINNNIFLINFRIKQINEINKHSNSTNTEIKIKIIKVNNFIMNLYQIDLLQNINV